MSVSVPLEKTYTNLMGFFPPQSNRAIWLSTLHFGALKTICNEPEKGSELQIKYPRN